MFPEVLKRWHRHVGGSVSNWVNLMSSAGGEEGTGLPMTLQGDEKLSPGRDRQARALKGRENILSEWGVSQAPQSQRKPSCAGSVGDLRRKWEVHGWDSGIH